MITRRTFVGGTAALLAAPLAAEAQQVGKVHRIGLLSAPPGGYVGAFEESLRQLGYVRGVNIFFETRSPGILKGAKPGDLAVGAP
jgi:hypothetical protein